MFDIQNHLEGKLKQVMHDCKYFALVLDESTDVMDVSQLLIYTRAIDSSFEVHEELLELVSLHDTTKGEDVFNAVKSALSEHRVLTSFSCCYRWRTINARRCTGFARLLQHSAADYLKCVSYFSGSVQATWHQQRYCAIAAWAQD